MSCVEGREIITVVCLLGCHRVTEVVDGLPSGGTPLQIYFPKLLALTLVVQANVRVTPNIFTLLEKV